MALVSTNKLTKFNLTRQKACNLLCWHDCDLKYLNQISPGKVVDLRSIPEMLDLVNSSMIDDATTWEELDQANQPSRIQVTTPLKSVVSVTTTALEQIATKKELFNIEQRSTSQETGTESAIKTE